MIQMNSKFTETHQNGHFFLVWKNRKIRDDEKTNDKKWGLEHRHCACWRNSNSMRHRVFFWMCRERQRGWLGGSHGLWNTIRMKKKTRVNQDRKRVRLRYHSEGRGYSGENQKKTKTKTKTNPGVMCINQGEGRKCQNADTKAKMNTTSKERRWYHMWSCGAVPSHVQISRPKK